MGFYRNPYYIGELLENKKSNQDLSHVSKLIVNCSYKLPPSVVILPSDLKLTIFTLDSHTLINKIGTLRENITLCEKFDANSLLYKKLNAL